MKIISRTVCEQEKFPKAALGKKGIATGPQSSVIPPVVTLSSLQQKEMRYQYLWVELKKQTG